jgi:hypothetical protein
MIIWGFAVIFWSFNYNLDLQSSSASGSQTLNVVPSPSFESTSILPS